MASETSDSSHDRTAELNALYDEYDIDATYDDPNSCPNKRYPPENDWQKRKRALLDYYDHGCGRCGAPLGPKEPFECHLHHIIPLSENGSNHLSNLVPICEYCHALMHPENQSLDADWREARLFPADDADWRVAVERRPQTDFERAVYEDRSEPGDRQQEATVNVYAQSAATTSTPARLAVKKQNPTDEDRNRLDPDAPFELFCRECGTSVDPDVTRCPSCRAAADLRGNTRFWYVVGGGTGLLLGAAVPFLSGPVVYYCGRQLGDETPGPFYRALGGFYTVTGLGLLALLGVLFLPALL